MHKIAILIVEDNPNDVFLVVEALNFESIPHVITVMKDGAEAIAYIDRLSEEGFPCPDVILLDLKMPKVGGLEVLNKLRQHCKGAETPAIIYSSSAMPADQTSAEHLNARFFRKPVDFEEWMQLGKMIRAVTPALGIRHE